MKLLAYARVSTKEKAQGDSCERQVQMLLDYATRHAIEIMGVERDDGYTGSNERRPGWRSVVESLEAGAGGVLAVDLSRLHRNAGDAIKWANEYIVRRGLNLVLLSERVDMTTAAGKMQYNIMVSAAQFHSDVTKEKTKRALAYKRDRGEKLGGYVPYGYRSDGKILVLDPEEQSHIAQMRVWQAEGQGYTAIASRATREGWLTKMGSTRWDAKTVCRILQRAS